jgi:hypothetical protein
MDFFGQLLVPALYCMILLSQCSWHAVFKSILKACVVFRMQEPHACALVHAGRLPAYCGMAVLACSRRITAVMTLAFVR